MKGNALLRNTHIPREATQQHRSVNGGQRSIVREGNVLQPVGIKERITFIGFLSVLVHLHGNTGQTVIGTCPHAGSFAIFPTDPVSRHGQRPDSIVRHSFLGSKMVHRPMMRVIDPQSFSAANPQDTAVVNHH